MDYPTEGQWRELMNSIENCEPYTGTIEGFAQRNFHEGVFSINDEYGAQIDMSIYCNAPATRWRENDGFYNLTFRRIGRSEEEVNVTFLENYFIEVLNPTESERELFKLEFNIDYPVVTKEEL